MDNNYLDQVQTDLKAYVKTQMTIGKLQLVGGISHILGIFLLALTIILLLFALLSFLAVSAISALSIALPLWASALIMAAFYLLLILIAIVCRKQLFINPFVRRLSQIFFAREKQEMEEEQLRKEAEND
jgi:hypothetical protein